MVSKHLTFLAIESIMSCLVEKIADRIFALVWVLFKVKPETIPWVLVAHLEGDHNTQDKMGTEGKPLEWTLEN